MELWPATVVHPPAPSRYIAVKLAMDAGAEIFSSSAR
jgi:hypothetical protein